MGLCSGNATLKCCHPLCKLFRIFNILHYVLANILNVQCVLFCYSDQCTQIPEDGQQEIFFLRLKKANNPVVSVDQLFFQQFVIQV